MEWHLLKRRHSRERGNPCAREGAADAIGTASVWQARQPVNARSVGRWRAYAEYLPELVDAFPGNCDD